MRPQDRKYLFLEVLNDMLVVLYMLVLHCVANWKEELQKFVSPDNLPEFYGGIRREPDPTCSKYVCNSVAVH